MNTDHPATASALPGKARQCAMQMSWLFQFKPDTSKSFDKDLKILV